MNELWLILFSIVLLFDWMREQQYIFIYYTIWTFTLETIFFIALVFKKTKFAEKVFPVIYAPSIVVCVGFWLIVAPRHLHHPQFTNIVLTVVVHGLNTVALISQPFPVYSRDWWKPVLYTILYNIFLAIYVGAGFRSISGRLPYWYAQYDNIIGWSFATMATVAVATVHTLSSSKYIKKTDSKPIIV